MFDAHGFLRAKYLDGLEITTYDYDAKGRLTRITPPSPRASGRVYEWSYGDQATDGTQTHTVSLSDNSTTVMLRQYKFDADKQVTCIIHKDGTATSSDPKAPAYTTTLTYSSGAPNWMLLCA